MTVNQKTLDDKPHRVQYHRGMSFREDPNRVSSPDKLIVYVGRPSPWGNPFKMENEEDRERVIRLFQAHLLATLKRKPDFLEPLRGKNLACWCPLDKKCHADILLELANQ